MSIFTPQIAYAEVNSLDLINGTTNNLINTINSSWDFWIWIIGIGITIWVMGMFMTGFTSFFKTIFGIKKGRKY